MSDRNDIDSDDLPVDIRGVIYSLRVTVANSSHDFGVLRNSPVRRDLEVVYLDRRDTTLWRLTFYGIQAEEFSEFFDNAKELGWSTPLHGRVREISRDQWEDATVAFIGSYGDVEITARRFAWEPFQTPAAVLLKELKSLIERPSMYVGHSDGVRQFIAAESLVNSLALRICVCLSGDNFENGHELWVSLLRELTGEPCRVVIPSWVRVDEPDYAERFREFGTELVERLRTMVNAQLTSIITRLST